MLTAGRAVRWAIMLTPKMATMNFDLESPSTPKTQWTGLLTEGLFAALKNGRDNATVRGLANELVNDKETTISVISVATRRLMVIRSCAHQSRRNAEKDMVVDKRLGLGMWW